MVDFLSRPRSSVTLLSALVFCFVILGCSGCGGSNDTPTLVTWNIGGRIDAGLDKYGGLAVSKAPAEKAIRAVVGGFIYVTGKEGAQAVLKEIETTDDTQGYIRQAVFDGASMTPPGPYPSVFDYNGNRYLLFTQNNQFKMYVVSSRDAAKVYLDSVSIWNFGAVESFINGSPYSDLGVKLAYAPAFNRVRNKLYFSLLWAYSKNESGSNLIRSRIFESTLSGGAFTTPTIIPGDEADPAAGVHYPDGLRHAEGDQIWIGKLCVTADGQKAFFNVLSICLPIQNPGDPFYAPVPNVCNRNGLDVRNPAMINTYILTADIASDGSFVNVRQLPPAVNRGGINFVCDVSEDGSQIYVGHMVMDDEFWAYGWGPDGLAMECCFKPPYEVAPWDGEIEIIPTT